MESKYLDLLFYEPLGHASSSLYLYFYSKGRPVFIGWRIFFCQCVQIFLGKGRTKFSLPLALVCRLELFHQIYWLALDQEIHTKRLRRLLNKLFYSWFDLSTAFSLIVLFRFTLFSSYHAKSQTIFIGELFILKPLSSAA